MNDAVEQPFLALARELAEPLRRYLLRCTGDGSAASDLAQETLLRMARGFPSFDGRASVKTWAFTIASRVLADYFRKPEHRLRIVEIDEALELPSSDYGTDEQMVIDEMSLCVRQVIDSLPRDYRTALVLRDLEGLSTEETAQASGLSLGATKVRIHRARKRLRRALQAQCNFYRDGESIFRCEPK